MKRTLQFTLLLLSVAVFAQVPQGISYQAIALNGSGNPVLNASVGLKLSILDNSATGTVLYTETHTRTTNAQGLFNLVIGQGTPTAGNFAAIKWGTNSKFLKVEMDAAGGTSYVLTGSTQLLSVPYALYAGKVDYKNVIGNPDAADGLSFMTSSNAYVYGPTATGSGSSSQQWFSTAISGTPLQKSINSFMTSSNAYVFSPTGEGDGVYSNQWFSTALSGSPIKLVADYDNTGVVTTSNAYVFSSTADGTGSFSSSKQWFSTAISGTVFDIIDANGIIAVLTSTNAYVFAPTATGNGLYSNQWFSTAISGTPVKISGLEKGTGILIVTSTNAYVFAPVGFGNGVYSHQWTSTAVSGTPFQN